MHIPRYMYVHITERIPKRHVQKVAAICLLTGLPAP